MNSPRPFALWSPHRDSREVILWKSLLGFRSEPWHWVDNSELASWHIVDVSRGVDPAWTGRLGGPHRIRGIGLARQWLDIPDHAWTFFKVPLQMEDVHRWLDGILRNAPSAPLTAPEATGTSWQGQRLRLVRWPNVSRYDSDSIGLTLACSMMLRDWTPYEQLLEVVPAQETLHAMLAEAWQRGILQSAAEAPPAIPAPTVAVASPEEEGRGGLLKRIWNRFK